MMILWTGSKKLHRKSNDKIGPNEEDLLNPIRPDIHSQLWEHTCIDRFSTLSFSMQPVIPVEPNLKYTLDNRGLMSILTPDCADTLRSAPE